MDRQSESDNVVVETLKESAISKCVESEIKTISILIPIFCDLYSETYDAKFIAEMLTRQYLLETSIECIHEVIREYYKTGKI